VYDAIRAIADRGHFLVKSGGGGGRGKGRANEYHLDFTLRHDAGPKDSKPCGRDSLTLREAARKPCGQPQTNGKDSNAEDSNLSPRAGRAGASAPDARSGTQRATQRPEPPAREPALNAEADGGLASGSPPPPLSGQDQDALLRDIAAARFDWWITDGAGRPSPMLDSKHQTPEAVCRAWCEAIDQAAVKAGERSLALELYRVCGAKRAGEIVRKGKSSQYIAKCVRNAKVQLQRNAEPRPRNFAVILKDIAEAGFDNWELSSKGRPRPTEDSECRTPEEIYEAWLEASTKWAQHILGPEREHLINELYSALGRRQADEVRSKIRLDFEDPAAAVAFIARALEGEDQAR
jgi:hypothetical protein